MSFSVSKEPKYRVIQAIRKNDSQFEFKFRPDPMFMSREFSFKIDETNYFNVVPNGTAYKRDDATVMDIYNSDYPVKYNYRIIICDDEYMISYIRNTIDIIKYK